MHVWEDAGFRAIRTAQVILEDRAEQSKRGSAGSSRDDVTYGGGGHPVDSQGRQMGG